MQDLLTEPIVGELICDHTVNKGTLIDSGDGMNSDMAVECDENMKSKVDINKLQIFLDTYTIPSVLDPTIPMLRDMFCGELLYDHSNPNDLISDCVKSRNVENSKVNNEYVNKIINISAIILAAFLDIDIK